MTDPTEVEVLVVGGGPVGLTARALLERWGVRSMLVERYRGLSPFPRSRLVNVRSMEIFRQLGLAEEIRTRAFAPEFGRIRFRDTLHGRDFATAAMVGINAPIPQSPVIGVVTSQDRLEPVLLDAADTPARHGVELVDLAEVADGVVATLFDHIAGVETRVRAAYVLAADGANSTVRKHLGIASTGPGAIGTMTTVVFDADLHGFAAEQPAGVYTTAHGSFLPIYPEGGWAWIAPTPDDVEHADWSDLLSRALGTDGEVSAEVWRVQHWVVNASIAERFRRGRVLLAGDSAHAIPPAGGMGMNVGIADVHNLCWKLAGVLHGWATPALLDTYATERQPVAHRTLRQAVANAQLSHQAQARRRDQLLRGETAAEIETPWSEEYFAQLGLVLGVTYRSGAVLSGDEAPADPSDAGTDYVPSAEPGGRMPHLWRTGSSSTLDALGEWFTLLTPAAADWEGQKAAPWPLHVETLSAEHAELWGLGRDGAVLVRPDGHVGVRWGGLPSDSALQDALASITA